MSILRDYQRQAVRAFWDTLAAEPVNRVALEMATGLGKTITFGQAAVEYLDSFEGAGNRVLVLVHTDELVRQTVATLRTVAGDYSIGVVKATRNEPGADIVVASVQTLARPGRRDQITDVGLIIVDECHHATAATYQAILRHYGAMRLARPTPVLGVTATLARSDGASLGQVWQALPFTRSLSWGIRHGYLIDLVPYSITIPDLTLAEDAVRLDAQLAEGFAPEAVVQAWLGLAKSSKVQYDTEYDNSGVRESLDQADRKASTGATGARPVQGVGSARDAKRGIGAGNDHDLRRRDQSYGAGSGPAGAGVPAGPATSESVRAGDDSRNAVESERPSTVLFAPLVASAQRFADAFSVAGVKAEVVHGGQHPDERQAVLDRYNAGVTTVVCNAMVLTEGWDSPRTGCVIVARPTRSAPLFIQMVGRGLRRWLGAGAPPIEDQRCILLTVADTTTELATYADLSDAPVAPGQHGKSLLEMEDEWNLGRELDEAERAEYRGPVRVERWDALVRASSKAWKFTEAGVPFLPTAKRGQGYVFVVERAGEWTVWKRQPSTPTHIGGKFWTNREAAAPDLELAMALAEDIAQDLGGDIGALLADKTRAWRKVVPSPEMQDQARRLGIDPAPILASRAAGKAGKLSDLIDKVQASKVLDPVATKIKARE